VPVPGLVIEADKPGIAARPAPTLHCFIKIKVRQNIHAISLDVKLVVTPKREVIYPKARSQRHGLTKARENSLQIMSYQAKERLYSSVYSTLTPPLRGAPTERT